MKLPNLKMFLVLPDSNWDCKCVSEYGIAETSNPIKIGKFAFSGVLSIRYSEQRGRRDWTRINYNDTGREDSEKFADSLRSTLPRPQAFSAPHLY